MKNGGIVTSLPGSAADPASNTGGPCYQRRDPIDSAGMDANDRPRDYPTPFQKRTLWTGLTALAVVLIGAIAVGLIWLFTFVMGVLQPVFVPLAVAAVIAYLIYPLVDKLITRGLPQKRASLVVFVAFVVASGLLITAIAVPLSKQAAQLVRDFPSYINKFEQTLDRTTSNLKSEFSGHVLFGPIVEWLPEPGEVPPLNPSPPGPDTGVASVASPPSDTGAATPPAAGPSPPAPLPGEHDPSLPSFEPTKVRSVLLDQVPVVGRKVWDFVRRSFGGFLGAFGFLLGFALVPIYLFFFLREAPHIRSTWSDYLPIKASNFKTEVVDTLTDINGYLIAFFRGQMLVSLIDGLITSVVLTIIGLKFGLLIGVLVGILGIIPYLGIIMCYIPAVIIATVQGASHDWYMAPGAPWWVLPLVITIVFVAVNNLDGILIAPKIVGESVGLHPFTVIFSVLFWSLLLGGLLGALLAVPLTASLKVLFMRYIWERRVRPPARLTAEDRASEGAALT